MAVLEELINLIITFAFVLAPLWILMSRRRRMQQERQSRSGEPARQPQRRPPGEKSPAERPESRAEAQRDRERKSAGEDGYADRRRKDERYAAKDRQRAEPVTAADSGQSRTTGRLEKMLREVLGVPDPEELKRREQVREQERRRELERRKAQREARLRAERARKKREDEVPRHADVQIRAVMPESGSLSLSPGGLGSQQMRTAAGNLGASSSAEKSPPAVDSLGKGWQRVNRLSEFKRAVILADLLGKPHALREDGEQ